MLTLGLGRVVLGFCVVFPGLGFGGVWPSTGCSSVGVCVFVCWFSFVGCVLVSVKALTFGVGFLV